MGRGCGSPRRVCCAETRLGLVLSRKEAKRHLWCVLPFVRGKLHYLQTRLQNCDSMHSGERPRRKGLAPEWKGIDEFLVSRADERSPAATVSTTVISRRRSKFGRPVCHCSS